MAKSPKCMVTTSRRPTRKLQAGSATRPSSADIEDLATPGVLAGPALAAAALRLGLLRWYDTHRRDLPWRFSATPGPEGREKRAYAVWVSEVMLQQTRVPVVVDYYSRWMARWPTVETLATATQEEVNEMWAGLGYYRRARFLLEGAKQIAEKGEFPSTASTLRQVRGIGDYTAGAIASIAFNEVTPLVDGNVVRVISRIFAIADNPKESSTVKKFWELAGQLVDPSRPGDFNQAMMELGATLCSKTKPGCSQCPVSSHCQALTLSHENPSIGVTDYPQVVPKAKPRRDFAAVCVVQIAQGLEQEMAAGKCNLFLLIKRPEEGLLAGLWEFPSVLVDESKTDSLNRRKEMDKYLKQLLDIDVKRESMAAPAAAAAAAPAGGAAAATATVTAGGAVKYGGPLDVARHVLRSEGGMRGLFKGLVPTMAREVPGNAVMFGVYEATKQYMAGGQDTSGLGRGSLILAGGIAGAAFWSSVYPTDVVKSVLQVDDFKNPKYSGSIDAFKKILAADGVKGLYKGFGPAMARSVPANGACFLAYEVTKSLL